MEKNRYKIIPTLILVINLVLIITPSISQTVNKRTNLEDTYLYLFVDKLPEFPGGQKAFDLFINKHLNWPQKDMDIQGVTLLSFVITKNGNIIDIRVERSLNDVFDKEAKRIITLMPKWIPGEIHGSTINTRVYLPINFSLQAP
jgi:TonB family protein